MKHFLSTSGLVLCIIIACANCNNDLDDSEFVHSGIVKQMGLYKFSYDNDLIVIKINSDGANWLWIDIEYEGANVSRLIEWYDLDQAINISYLFDGEKLVKSYNEPTDAVERLTITTYSEVIDFQIKSAQDSFFYRRL